MKYTIAAALILTLMRFNAAAQHAYTTAKDAETGAAVFKGPVTFTDLKAEPSFSWMSRGESAYKPDTAYIRVLAKALPAYSIVTVMGTWCDDSQNLVPKLARVLQSAKYPMDKYLMFAADRAKETGGIERKLYGIEKVPTIIVFKGNDEVGRITESVHQSIEADLAAIVVAKQ